MINLIFTEFYINRLAHAVSTGREDLSTAKHITFLDLGPIDLQLLGLRVQVSQIVIEITADPSGGLLGQLLCGLAGDFDSGRLEQGSENTQSDSSASGTAYTTAVISCSYINKSAGQRGTGEGSFLFPLSVSPKKNQR
jgi:hypothetical protein